MQIKIKKQGAAVKHGGLNIQNYATHNNQCMVIIARKNNNTVMFGTREIKDLNI